MTENTNNLDEKLSLKLEQVLLDAKKVSNADGCTLYMLEDDGLLHFSIMVNDTLKLHMGGSSAAQTDIIPLRIYKKQTGEPNNNNVCTSAFANKKVINIANIYDPNNFDFSGTFMFDSKNNYKTVSILTVPLFDLRGDCVAVMQLINAKDEAGKVIAFSDDIAEDVQLIAGRAAVLVENSRLIQENHKILENLIEVFYRAIAQKTPSVASHCEQVPVIAKMLLSAACLADSGKFKDFELSDDELHSFNLASWLYGFGLLTTPDYLINKQNKLDAFYNRIENIRLKFEILLRDARISLLEGLLTDPSKKSKLKKAYDTTAAALQDEFAFIANCNLGTKTLTKKGVDELNKIAKRSFTNHFDKSLGYIAATELSTAKTGTLLDDESAQGAEYNTSELYNLSTKSGVLSEQEHDAVEKHLEQGIDILKTMSLPTDYQYAIDYVSTQRERVDGNGYPAHLTGDKIAIPARIIALASAFERLAAANTKEAKPLSTILDEMQKQVEGGALDPDLFHLFLTSGVYLDYAKEYMLPEQLDDPDISKYTDGYDENAPLTYADPYASIHKTSGENAYTPAQEQDAKAKDYATSTDFLGDLNNFSAEPEPLDVSDNTPMPHEPIFNPREPAFEPLSFSDFAEGQAKTSEPTTEPEPENIAETTDEQPAASAEMEDAPQTAEPATEPSAPQQTAPADFELDDDYKDLPDLENEPAEPAEPAEPMDDGNTPELPELETVTEPAPVPVAEPAPAPEAAPMPAPVPEPAPAPAETQPEFKSEPAPLTESAPAPAPMAEPIPEVAPTPAPIAPAVTEPAPVAPTAPAVPPVPPTVSAADTAPLTTPPLLHDNTEEMNKITPVATVEPPLLKETE